MATMNIDTKFKRVTFSAAFMNSLAKAFMKKKYPNRFPIAKSMRARRRFLSVKNARLVNTLKQIIKKEG
jgi:hypothetical protein